MYTRSRPLLLLVVVACGPGRGRDLACEQVELGPRAEAICRATEETLELSVCGRPIPMPGYVSEHGGVRHVYWKVGIDAADAPLLEQV